jgi:hypothetical protein
MRSFAQTTGTLPRMMAVLLAAAALATMLAVFLDVLSTTDGRAERLVLPEKTKSMIMMPQPRH